MNGENSNVLGEFWIPGNVPSSKNSRMIIDGHLIASEVTQKYKKQTKRDFTSQTIWFQYLIAMLGEPYYIEFTFIRKTRRKFDYINAAQIICDLMSKYNWIPDDNAGYIKPYFGDFKHDKHNPGVIIKILKEQPNHYDLPSQSRANR